jgi:hypothetical protein
VQAPAPVQDTTADAHSLTRTSGSAGNGDANAVASVSAGASTSSAGERFERLEQLERVGRWRIRQQQLVEARRQRALRQNGPHSRAVALPETYIDVN